MQKNTDLKAVFVAAVRSAIEEIGMDTFNQCSFFGSADCHKTGAGK